MGLKSLRFLFIFILLFSHGAIHALQLEMSPSVLEFDNNASPVTLEIRVYDEEKPVRWDSRVLKALSSDIKITDQQGESLGQDSTSGIIFFPIGTVDGYTYRLVGVVDRSVTDFRKFPIVVSIADNLDLQGKLSVIVPKFHSINQSDTKPVSIETTRLIEDVAEIKSSTNITNIMMGIAGFLLLSFIFAILLYVLSLKKSDSITEKEGHLTRSQQSDSHAALMRQGDGILSSTQLVDQKARELIRAADKIDIEVRSFAKKPSQNSEQISQHLAKMKELVSTVSIGTKANSDDLAVWLEKISHDRSALEGVVESMVDSVGSLTDRLQIYDQRTIQLYELISGIQPIDVNMISDNVIQAMRENTTKKV